MHRAAEKQVHPRVRPVVTVPPSGVKLGQVAAGDLHQDLGGPRTKKIPGPNDIELRMMTDTTGSAADAGAIDPRRAARKDLGDPIVEVENVSKRYTIDGRDEVITALDEISLSSSSEFFPVRKGEFVMILGPSGGGKTTLLNLIGTLDIASEGRLRILGNSIDSNTKDSFLSQLRLEKIGFVFQTFNLLATMSAFENVELPMTLMRKLSAKEAKTRALDLLTMVGLRDRVNHLPSELSGGEQQRVTIARALANDPELLLLDEPTGDLDTRNTVDIMDLLLSINQKRGTTCIMVTHNPDLECYADRVLYVGDGRFQRQAVNTVQSALPYDQYVEYLNSQQD